MLIVEYRVILPLTVEEYQVAQLWSVAEASKNETGGGEGIEVMRNEPFDATVENGLPELIPKPLLLGGDPNYLRGQYTHKCYHLASKVPAFIRLLAPKGALEVDETAWNAYPYCRTIVDNPSYMKENFSLKIETMHIDGNIALDNVHLLPPDLLAKRKVVYIDISNDQLYNSSDYNSKTDPKLVKSSKTGRGPLVSPEWWKAGDMPIMCAYKLVTCEFKWWGLQTRIEDFLQTQEQRIFTNFHRQVFCWMDNWFGLTMEDIRRIEDQTKKELDEQRQTGTVCGTIAAE